MSILHHIIKNSTSIHCNTCYYIKKQGKTQIYLVNISSKILVVIIVVVVGVVVVVVVVV